MVIERSAVAVLHGSGEDVSGGLDPTEKPDRTGRQGRPVGYKNGLTLNENLATAEKWTAAQIDYRTTKLVDSLMALFRMEGGLSSNHKTVHLGHPALATKRSKD